jgi:hypothetical protein
MLPAQVGVGELRVRTVPPFQMIVVDPHYLGTTPEILLSSQLARPNKLIVPTVPGSRNLS